MNLTNIVKELIPPSGWHFIEMPEVIRIDGLDAADVVKNIGIFRGNNNRPAGNPEEEFAEFVCKNFPTNCKNANLQIIPGKPRKPRLMDRVGQWAAFLSSRTAMRVGHSERAHRLALCQNCPKRREWRTCTSCGGTVSGIERILNFLRNGEAEGMVKGGCDAHGFDCPTAASLTKETIAYGLNQDAPDYCWMR